MFCISHFSKQNKKEKERIIVAAEFCMKKLKLESSDEQNE